MNEAIEMIAAERERQIKEEGFDAKHDADEFHQNGELAQAACYYAWPHDWVDSCSSDAYYNHPVESVFYPITWSKKWAKRSSKSRLRQLVVAGALIAAEIDRLLKERGEK